MICPRCKGVKEIHGFGCPGFIPVTMDCPQCAGVGVVPPEMAQWIEHGKKLKAIRIERTITMREMAKFKGLRASEISDIEQGRANNLGIEYNPSTGQGGER